MTLARCLQRLDFVCADAASSLLFAHIDSSHRSGKALLAVSGFVGALLPILNLVLAILMILTFLSGKTCDSVRDDSLLSQVEFLCTTVAHSYGAAHARSCQRPLPSLFTRQIIDNPANFDNEYILASAVRI